MTDDNVPVVEAVIENDDDSLQVQIEETIVRAKEQVTQFTDQVSAKVREKPLTALAIAATVGYLGARLLFPRRS